MAEEVKKKEKTGKKKHVNKPSSKKWKFYKIAGDQVTRDRCCPRCGQGIFLMKSKERVYCGKCHYTEFISETKK